MKTVNLACVGRWHVHAQHFLERAYHYPATKIVAIWDADPATAQAWAEESHIPLAPSYEALLADASIDGLIITAPTRDHASLVTCAAAAGKHIYLEKAPALTIAEAQAIYDAVKQSGVRFLLSDPVKKPPLLYAKQLADKGVLGEITSARIRTVHPLGLDGTQIPAFYDKDEAGAGAMIDMGCHGIHILRWFLGDSVDGTGLCSPYTPLGKKTGIDENSAAIFLFPHGVYGIVETTWVSPKYEYEFNLYGTRGCLAADTETVWLRTDGANWRRIPDDELPPPYDHPLHRWIESLRGGPIDTLYTVEDVLPLTRMIQAAYRKQAIINPDPQR